MADRSGFDEFVRARGPALGEGSASMVAILAGVVATLLGLVLIASWGRRA